MPKYGPPLDSLVRCPWSHRSALEINYHDTEWGRPCFDTQKLFEYLILDTFQAGISWRIILQKREGFRAAFYNFSAQAMAAMSDHELEFLLQNPAIIRNRLKVWAARKNARVFLEVEEKNPGGFAHLIWKHVKGIPIVNTYTDQTQVPAKTIVSEALSKELNKTGFSFFGPVTAYAFMQAAGLVNDHLVTCHCHPANIVA